MAANEDERAAQRWNRHIPHYALTMDLLPRPQAPWDELVHFAGTFDGTAAFPTATGVRQHAFASRTRFLSDGTLPAGLTMLRAALHGEQRIDYWSDSEGHDTDAMRHIHALVEAIRAAVKAGVHVTPNQLTDAGVQDKVMNAFDRLVAGYAVWGGHQYHGWTSYEDPANYLGPVVWSERDVDLRFALELEREFPLGVHMEFAIGKASRIDYDHDTEGRQRVDVAVTDLSAFVEDDGSYDRFRSHRHDACFEVKLFMKGWGDNRDAKNRLDDIPVDIAKLANHVRLGRCKVAGMLVVDDEGYFQAHGATDDWPAGVWRLYVGESALSWRGLLPDDA